MFGFFPGLVGSRDGYYGTMASYVLAHSGELKRHMIGYNKQKFLKFRGDREILESAKADVEEA